MSKTKNIAHNLLARLGNAAALIKFSDGSYHSLEHLFRRAKANNISEIEIEIVSGDCTLPESDDLRNIVTDLLDQLVRQLQKNGVNESAKSCTIRIAFDLLSEAPDSVNKGSSSCNGVCNIVLDS